MCVRVCWQLFSQLIGRKVGVQRLSVSVVLTAALMHWQFGDQLSAAVCQRETHTHPSADQLHVKHQIRIRVRKGSERWRQGFRLKFNLQTVDLSQIRRWTFVRRENFLWAHFWFGSLQHRVHLSVSLSQTWACLKTSTQLLSHKKWVIDTNIYEETHKTCSKMGGKTPHHLLVFNLMFMSGECSSDCCIKDCSLWCTFSINWVQPALLHSSLSLTKDNVFWTLLTQVLNLWFIKYEDVYFVIKSKSEVKTSESEISIISPHSCVSYLVPVYTAEKRVSLDICEARLDLAPQPLLGILLGRKKSIRIASYVHVHHYLWVGFSQSHGPCCMVTAL